MSSQHLLLGFLQPMDMNCYVSLKWRLLSKDCITHCCAIRRGKTIFVVTLLRDICGQNGFKQNAKQSQQNDTLRTQSGVHKYVNEIKKIWLIIVFTFSGILIDISMESDLMCEPQNTPADRTLNSSSNSNNSGSHAMFICYFSY